MMIGAEYFRCRTGRDQPVAGTHVVVYSSAVLKKLALRSLGISDLPDCLDLAESRGWEREADHWAILAKVGHVVGLDHPDHPGLAGTVAISAYGDNLGAIGMLLVSSDVERQGIGRYLMSQALERLQVASVLLCATPEGYPLYVDMGFKDCGYSYELSGRGLFSGFAWPSYVRRYLVEDWESLRGFDRDSLGADRTRLLKRLLKAGGDCVVAEGQGGISGFAVAWRNMDSIVIGPVLAVDMDTACALIASLCSRFSETCVLYLGLEQIGIRAWALNHGFTERRSLPLMAHGDIAPPGYSTRYFALASPALL
jgi:GNAT superfamily N-acetyltransferase